MNQKGIGHLILIAVIGVISFLAISSSAPLRDGFLATIFPKEESRAAAPPGVWENVTPSNMDLVSNLSCDSYGVGSIVVDPKRPSDLYANANCLGTWKSTDYGQTWNGPINTGTNGVLAGDCAGAIAIAPGNGNNPPILYQACIRGQALWQTGNGFWRSLDGGVNWESFFVQGSIQGRQDFYGPDVDPYDPNHLIMAGHEMNAYVQSFDGGQTWSSINIASGMMQNGGTAAFNFINTGNATTTRNTWLYTPQGTGGTIGMWRTENGGTTWTKVDNNEKAHGPFQLYQPDTSGVLFVPGVYSALGHGVLRSTDYGKTWTHVGANTEEAVVFGTPNKVYSMYSWACKNCDIDPRLQTAPQPGATGWQSLTRPPGMTIGPTQAAVTFDGSNYIIVTGNWNNGIWRYVEPASANSSPTASPSPTSTPSPTATPVVTPTPAPTGGPINDTWVFYGDSITAISMVNGTLHFQTEVNRLKPNVTITKVVEGWGGQSTGSVLDPSSGGAYIDNVLARIPANTKYMTISLGSNDSAGNGTVCYQDMNQTYNNLVTLVQKVQAAGKIAIVPTIPSAYETNCGDLVTAEIQKVYTNFPSVVRGPDLWAKFKNQTQWFPNIHPSSSGIDEYNKTWADWAVANIYSSNPASKPGDFDNTGSVGVGDLSFLLSRWGTNDTAADLNKNGSVGVGDLSILLSNWG